MSNLSNDPEDDAAALGLQVVLPEPEQLLIDIDSEQDYEHVINALAVFIENGENYLIEKVVPSKTPGHGHVYVRCPRPISAIERIALQAIFGSDKKREALSYLRYERGYLRPPTCFFEART